MDIKIFGKDEKSPIQNIKEWEKHGEPAEKYHWKKGRSAYEVANSWLPNNKPGVPKNLIKILTEHFQDEITFEKGIVEKKTYFSDTSSGPRNHDLLATATLGGRKIVIGIEGKERESYDKVLSKKFDNVSSPNSKLPDRIEHFCSGILGNSYSNQLKNLYYQFLSGIAGVAVEVNKQNADLGMFIVQQFKSNKTPIDDLKRNEESFIEFLKFMGKPDPQNTGIESNSGIWGPYKIPGSELVPSTKMFIGKFYTNVELA